MLTLSVVTVFHFFNIVIFTLIKCLATQHWDTHLYVRTEIALIFIDIPLPFFTPCSCSSSSCPGNGQRQCQWRRGTPGGDHWNWGGACGCAWEQTAKVRRRMMPSKIIKNLSFQKKMFCLFFFFAGYLSKKKKKKPTTLKCSFQNCLIVSLTANLDQGQTNFEQVIFSVAWELFGLGLAPL